MDNEYKKAEAIFNICFDLLSRLHLQHLPRTDNVSVCYFINSIKKYYLFRNPPPQMLLKYLLLKRPLQFIGV